VDSQNSLIIPFFVAFLAHRPDSYTGRLSVKNEIQNLQPIDRRVKIERGTMALSKSGAKRTLIIFTIVNACAVLTLIGAFSIITSRDMTLLRDTILSFSRDTAMTKAHAAVNAMGITQAQSYAEFTRRIENYCRDDRDILTMILFSKTADEQYFSVASKLELDPHLSIPVELKQRVREGSEENWLKKGLSAPSISPSLFSDKTLYWYNVYLPVILKEGQFVVRFSVSATGAALLLEDHAAKMSIIQIGAVALTAILILITLVASFFFLRNFSMLMSGIAGYVKMAASGATDLSLNENADEDLFELALSFNTLVGELKEKERLITDLREKERIAIQSVSESISANSETNSDAPIDLSGQVSVLQEQLAAALADKERMIQESSRADELSEGFRKGVELLKKGSLAEAEAVFRALTIIKPDGFGAYFNLGVVLAKQRNFDRSLEMFEKAREINPSHTHTAVYIEKVMRMRNNRNV
jgi:TolA-binding protein